MANNLYYNTVTPQLLGVLEKLMHSEEFNAFRLVGGTALSLFKGHRESIDIDLFTDAEYGSIDFEIIDNFLRKNYKYVSVNKYEVVGMGKSYFVGDNEDDSVKLDVFYTDEFVFDIEIIDGIRLASVEEISAMKLEIISSGGRKKDFWDLHEIADSFSIDQLLAFHEKRYPYTHDSDLIRSNFSEFTKADKDFDPVCLRGKYWEIIKSDMIDFANKK